LRPGMEEDVRQAKAVADRIGIPFHVFSFREDFERKVIDPFVRTYREGGTPNPCVLCNREMKFGRFLEEAEKLGYDGVATGHYASVLFENGRFVLKKAASPEKDQSYVLYGLSQKQLERVILPLGGFQKSEVRRMAEENGFAAAQKKESQDICFIRDGDYASFLYRYDGVESVPGPFEDLNGRRIGTHRGIVHYTVGQRKGLGLALPEPYYVFEKDPERNAVVLCPKSGMLQPSFTARSFNWVSFPPSETPVSCTVRTRYHQKEIPAVLVPLEDGRVRFDFESPSDKPARGQSAVAYSGDYVIGGGIIE
ncbi:MAG: tRNA 2-thiouridine(34) synthase MnmA, partial [Clostridia bacterium]|nr:tRNA 2-thiouridine(34) synthase MnmA [Clostridia bacterium]